MCKKGNQTISKQCLEVIRTTINTQVHSNKELQSILSRHGGCMVQSPKTEQPVT